MPKQIVTVGSSVSYYRGRFRAAVAWSKVSREHTVATAVPPKKHDSNLTRIHSAIMTSEAFRHASG